MDKILILNNIKKHYGFKTDAEFARFLGINPQNIRNWFARNNYNANLLIEKCAEINPQYIITGDGEMLKKEAQPNKISATLASLSDEELSELIASRMEKKMLDMYSEGRIYSREAVERIINMHQKELAEAQKKIGRLEDELERMRLATVHRAGDTTSKEII